MEDIIADAAPGVGSRPTITETSKQGRSSLCWIATLLSAAHLLTLVVAGRARWEHMVADALVMTVPWLGAAALGFMRGALPLWLALALYDSQFVWLPWRGAIHTGDLYARELAWFPAQLEGHAVTWPEWFSAHSTAWLDAITGAAYLVYIWQFFGVCFFLFIVQRRRFESLSWSFLLIIAMAMIIYTLYPAAPPWYVVAHGMGPADLTALPSAAGAARFDTLFGIHYFAEFYARNPNVFGAMPSLHVGFPALVVMHTWDRGVMWRVLTVSFTLLVAFSAVYLAHHYILDAIAGVGVAAAATGVYWQCARALRRAELDL